MYEKLHAFVQTETAFDYEISGAVYWLENQVEIKIHHVGDFQEVEDAFPTAAQYLKKKDRKWKFMVFHSHPHSDDCFPSEMDEKSHCEFKKWMTGDELIVAMDGIYSFREGGKVY